ncbi:hypothetical protein RHMOL_Rhmol12G0089800 [Rhododendron molle]|uniref:Uncharacterized protein n=1 Tax=Rhododendron molle TaxID=49168 RepID=A0ACC0LFU5_RHOML|nr:hypothetical protein RHMOL_Rhmol12G0089800 [Rhododendron molle]
MLQCTIDDFPCIIVNVYAPNITLARRNLWEELLALKANHQNPWCIGGDFNEIREVSERLFLD